MSELFGNPEQVSELSGNPEQLPYTPTTEEVRGAYEGQLIKVGNNAYQLLDEAHAKAEFYRWLADIRKQERERAINIIDKATLHYGKTHSASTVCRICEMLLAIEGEDA